MYSRNIKKVADKNASILIVIFISIILLFLADRESYERETYDLIQISCEFESYRVKQKANNIPSSLILYSPDYELPFELVSYDKYKKLPPPQTLCNGETYILTVRQGQYEYYIHDLSDIEGTSYISVDQPYETVGIIALIVICFIILAAALTGIVVARYPDIYGKKIKKLYTMEKLTIEDMLK